MGQRFGVVIEGGEQLQKDLRDLGLNTKKTLKGAVRAGTKVMAKAANANAAMISTRPGKKVSVRVRVRPGDWAVGSVFPAKGKAHLRLFEYGTKPGWRWARKKGPFRFYAGTKLIVTRVIHHPGMAKRPWLQPAVDASKDGAFEAFGEALKETIEKAKIAPEGNDE